MAWNYLGVCPDTLSTDPPMMKFRFPMEIRHLSREQTQRIKNPHTLPQSDTRPAKRQFRLRRDAAHNFDITASLSSLLFLSFSLFYFSLFPLEPTKPGHKSARWFQALKLSGGWWLQFFLRSSLFFKAHLLYWIQDWEIF